MVVDGTGTLAPGEGVVENTIVIATDSTAAERLVPELRSSPSRSVVCFYFTAPRRARVSSR